MTRFQLVSFSCGGSVEMEELYGIVLRTRVISVVIISISRSSAERSVNPGRACLACSLSRDVTAAYVISNCGSIYRQP
jgi:hypothetical protein